MRVVTVSRTSGDEADDQDIEAQARQLRDATAEDEHDLVAEYRDEGVSGKVPPLERPGFAAAVQDVLEDRADEILMRHADRYDRRHPWRSGPDYLDLLERGVRVRFLTGRQLPQDPDVDAWDLGDTLVATVELGQAHAYRQAVVRNTRLAMDDLRHGRRETRSGKPVGRPEKVSQADIDEYYPIAVALGGAEAARRLSVAKGWRPDQDPRTQKKYRVARTSLITAFQRHGRQWPP